MNIHWYNRVNPEKGLEITLQENSTVNRAATFHIFDRMFVTVVFEYFDSLID